MARCSSLTAIRDWIVEPWSTRRATLVGRNTPARETSLHIQFGGRVGDTIYLGRRTVFPAGIHSLIVRCHLRTADGAPAFLGVALGAANEPPRFIGKPVSLPQQRTVTRTFDLRGRGVHPTEATRLILSLSTLSQEGALVLEHLALE